MIPNQAMFHDTPAAIRVSTEVSFPAALSNMLLLVDYVATESPVPTPWAWGVWEKFDEAQRSARYRLSPILIHGLILEEHWIRDISGDLSEAREWGALRSMVADYSPQTVRHLVASGCVSGIQFYINEMSRTDTLDSLLPENVEKLQVEDLMNDFRLLEKALKFAYRGWGASDDSLAELVAFAMDPRQVIDSILILLDALIQNGGKDLWESQRDEISSWVDQTRTFINSHSWTNGYQAVVDLTRRTPPEPIRKQLELAEKLVLLPVPGMGRSQRLFVHGNTVYLTFTPATSMGGAQSATDPMKLADAVALLRAVADPAAFSLIQALGEGERYAQQLADHTSIHQSSVSRHLTVLERFGAIHVRRDGKTKWYTLVPDRIDQAWETIRGAIGTDNGQPK